VCAAILQQANTSNASKLYLHSEPPNIHPQDSSLPCSPYLLPERHFAGNLISAVNQSKEKMAFFFLFFHFAFVWGGRGRRSCEGQTEPCDNRAAKAAPWATRTVRTPVVRQRGVRRRVPCRFLLQTEDNFILQTLIRANSRTQLPTGRASF